MDTGTGNIFEQDKIDLKNIKGDLVQWRVGEEVLCKGCKFKVIEIKVFPDNEITLRGIPNEKAIEKREN